jgi:hypothetical protein
MLFSANTYVTRAIAYFLLASTYFDKTLQTNKEIIIGSIILGLFLIIALIFDIKKDMNTSFIFIILGEIVYVLAKSYEIFTFYGEMQEHMPKSN